MRSRLLLLAAICASLTACKKSQSSSNSCNTSLDCRAPGTTCNTSTHECICSTDEACPMGQFCNKAGVCQAKAGCSSNADCTKGAFYCDVLSGTCLDGQPMELGSKCGLVTHCPYGTVCMSGSCQEGCFGDGDCVLGEVCSNNVCTSAQGICSTSDFCGYGEICSGSTSPMTCKKDFRGPYCRGCTMRNTANPEPCDAPQNFCLINNLETAGHREYCGVDCSLGQPCPNGYFCDGVVILTEEVCTTQAECKCDRSKGISFATATCTVAAACDPRKPDGTPDPNAQTCIFPGEPACNGGVATGTVACVVHKGLKVGACECARDSDCPPGGSCVAGLCCSGGVPHPSRNCAGGEATTSGFCTCEKDSDCPRDVCDGSRSACVITGLPCTPGMDDCPPIPCVMGGCVIGKNCAPSEGFNCTILSGGG